MLIRVLVGAVAGGIAGFGLNRTWLPWMLAKCDEAETDGPECGVAVAFSLPWFLLFWTLVAGVLVFLAFKLLGRAGSWSTTGLGCLFWVPMWVVAARVGWLGTEDPKEILVPVIGFALGAVVTGRSSSSAHGHAAPESA